VPRTFWGQATSRMRFRACLLKQWGHAARTLSSSLTRFWRRAMPTASPSSSACPLMYYSFFLCHTFFFLLSFKPPALRNAFSVAHFHRFPTLSLLGACFCRCGSQVPSDWPRATTRAAGTSTRQPKAALRLRFTILHALILSYFHTFILSYSFLSLSLSLSFFL